MPFEIKNTKDFPYFKDFFFKNMKLHVLYNTQVYNKTGNAHKNELDEKYQMPPTDPSETSHDFVQ